MKKEKIQFLHIMINDKFIKEYILFLENNFVIKNHNFLIIDGVLDEKYPILERNYIKICKVKKTNNKFLKILYILKILLFQLKVCSSLKADKIFYHGISEKGSILFLFLFKKYLSKSYWGIWGGDLYCYLLRQNNRILYNIYYKIENYVKGNFKGYITQVKGDYEVAKKYYKAKGQYYDSFVLPSNMYHEIQLLPFKLSNVLCIQIGNSAIESNNHFEILEKLKKYKNNNIKLYCPLSYGNKKYAEEVIKVGKEIFKEKFIPILEYLEYSNYLKFLSNIDIAIFAHDIQHAVGNITSLLGMKKTIYLKEKVTTYEMLKGLGIKVKSFDKFNDLEVLEDKILEKNKKIIKERFSKERLIKDLEKIFYD